MDILWTLLIGAWIGIMGCSFAEKYGDSYYNRQKTLIEDCEKSLPRDQNCKLIAVPVSKD